MGRIYTAQFGGSAQTTGIGVFSLPASATQILILHSLFVGQSSDAGDANAQMLRMVIAKAFGTFTNSAGGTTVTPTPHQHSDVAFGGTVRARDTSIAIAATGTLTHILEETANVQAGWYYTPTPEERIVISPSQTLLVSAVNVAEDFVDVTPTALANGVTFSARMTFEVLGTA